MIKVGVTGGIGAGKSTVCGIFSVLGIPVYDSDLRARRLMENDPSVIAAIKELLGKDAYPGGRPDRPFIASKVFADRALLGRLNNIVHPAVHLDFEAWCREQSSPYVIQEAAVLFESGAPEHLDKIVVVTAPEELRIERAMRRDGVGREQVVSRMAAQMSQQDMASRADYIIDAGDEALITPQVLTLHETLLDLE